MICNILQTQHSELSQQGVFDDSSHSIISVSHLLLYSLRKDAHGHGCGTEDHTIEVAEMTC
jgi:hypothetical protein